jgi:hypothetical protein
MPPKVQSSVVQGCRHGSSARTRVRIIQRIRHLKGSFNVRSACISKHFQSAALCSLAKQALVGAVLDLQQLHTMGKRERSDNVNEGAAEASQSRVRPQPALPNLRTAACCCCSRISALQATAKHPRKAMYRARAHSNPFNDNTTFDVPVHPEQVDW